MWQLKGNPLTISLKLIFPESKTFAQMRARKTAGDLCGSIANG